MIIKNMKINVGWFEFKIYTISELIISEIAMVFLSFIGCLFFSSNKFESFFFFLKRLTFVVLTRPFFIGILRINKIKDERIMNALSQGLFVVIFKILDKNITFFK